MKYSSFSRIGRNILNRSFRMLNGWINDPSENANTRTRDTDKQLQILLSLRYAELKRDKHPLPTFQEVEFSSYSQNGEDGIILLIFSVIGTESKKVLEICAGDGIECNAANLVINHGWNGLLFDGSKKLNRRGERFYSGVTNAWRSRRIPPKIVNAWVNAENVNELIKENGFQGEIDLFSLDMDGVDYWIWKALEVVKPRVVLLEYNNRLDPTSSLTVPYDPAFIGRAVSTSGEGYFGASLLAFNKLATEKGYRLIGSNSPNTNAFFMRNDIAEQWFPEVPVETCLKSDYARRQMDAERSVASDHAYTKV